MIFSEHCPDFVIPAFAKLSRSFFYEKTWRFGALHLSQLSQPLPPPKPRHQDASACFVTAALTHFQHFRWTHGLKSDAKRFCGKAVTRTKIYKDFRKVKRKVKRIRSKMRGSQVLILDPIDGLISFKSEDFQVPGVQGLCHPVPFTKAGASQHLEMNSDVSMTFPIKIWLGNP